MTADKSRANTHAQRCALPASGRSADGIPSEGLRSSMRQGSSGLANQHSVRIEGLPVGKGCDEIVGRMQPSFSAASMASTDCAPSFAGRASSRSVSESSLSGLEHHSGASAAANLPPIPRTFVCPISLQVMTDPVSTVDGMIYDRQNIEAFFRSGRHTSPVTGMQLSSLKLRPNTALKEAIEAYLELHREAECQWKDWEAYMRDHADRSTQKLSKKRMQIRELKAALEASERQVLALELGSHSSSKKGSYAASNTSSAPSSTDESGNSSLELSPPPREEANWKAGPAPRPDPNLIKRPQEKSRGLLSFFR